MNTIQVENVHTLMLDSLSYNAGNNRCQSPLCSLVPEPTPYPTPHSATVAGPSAFWKGASAAREARIVWE